MPTILQKILEEIKTSDNVQKIRETCDKIQKEETIEHIDYVPMGPNIFLVLEVPARKFEISFLTLERESDEHYLSILYTVLKPKSTVKDPASLKRKRVWEINDKRPEAVLTAYAKTYKFLRGE